MAKQLKGFIRTHFGLGRISKNKRATLAVLVIGMMLSVPLAGLLSVLVNFASAVTTVSTDVVTGGNLQASSSLLVTGAVTTYGTGTFGDAAGDIYKFTGQLHASTTSLFTTGISTYGNSTLGDTAADITTFTGQLHASTTSLFTTGITTYGASTFGDAATDLNKFTGELHASNTALFTNGLTAYSSITLQNAETIGNATDGNVFVNATTLSVATSTASTTAGALWVSAPAGTTTTTVQINGNIVGNTGSATPGSCIQMWRENSTYRIYVNAAGTGLTVQAGSCRD